MKQNTSNQGKAEAAGYVDWVIVGCFALVLVCAAAACLIGLNSSRKQPTAPQTTASPPPAANDREAMQAILPNASPTTETPAPPYVAWEVEAVRRHPALGIDGSPLNTEFMALYKRYQKNRPGYFSDPKWPIRLAEKAVESLRDVEQEAQTQQAAALGAALGIPSRQFKRSLVATKEALRRYPELGIAGSRLNAEFIALYNRYQDTEREVLTYTGWPIRLADEAVASMRSADAEQQAQAQQQQAEQDTDERAAQAQQAAMRYRQVVAQKRQAEQDTTEQEAQQAPQQVAQQQEPQQQSEPSNGPVRMPMHSRYDDPVMEAWAEDRDRAISEGRQPPPPPDLERDESQFSSDPTHQMEQQRTRIEDLEDAQRRENFDKMNQQMQDSDDR